MAIYLFFDFFLNQAPDIVNLPCPRHKIAQMVIVHLCDLRHIGPLFHDFFVGILYGHLPLEDISLVIRTGVWQYKLRCDWNQSIR